MEKSNLMTEPETANQTPGRREVSLTWFLVFFCLILVVGLFFLPAETGIRLYRKTGYFSIFLTFAAWCFSWGPVIPAVGKARDFLRRNAWGIILSLVLTLLVFRVSPPRFRVFADEMNLLGVSAAMHQSREIHNPTQQVTSFNVRVTLDRQWDKRPLGFPFFVSLAHAFLGYAPGNAFVVNFLFSWGTLFLFFLLLSSRFSAGESLVGMSCLPLFPVMVHAMTSGSFEILNLAFLLLSLLVIERVYRFRDEGHFLLLGFTVLLLAQIRYESLLFGLLFGGAGAYLCRRVALRFSLRLFLFPFLALPIGWNVLAVRSGTSLSESYGENIFHWSNIGTNLQSLIRGFLGFSETFQGTPLLAGFALFSALWFLIRFDVVRSEWTPQDVHQAGFLTLCGGLFSGVILFYKPADVVAPEAARIALPFVPLIGFWVVWGIRRLGLAFPPIPVGITLFLLYSWHWTAFDVMPTVRIAEVREFDTIHRVLDRVFPLKDVLVLYPDPGHVIHHGWNGVSFRFLAENREIIRKMLAMGWFQKIVAVQRIGTETGLSTPETSFLAGVTRGETFFRRRIDRETQLWFSLVTLPGPESGR
jgi:hypothetical protein